MTNLLSSKSFIPSALLIVFAIALLFQSLIFDSFNQISTNPEATLAQASQITTATTESQKTELLESFAPIFKEGSESPESISNKLTAQGVLVLDVQSGESLLSKNPDLALPPASVTKLMTALVAREVFYLDQVLQTNKPTASAGTVIDFSQSESLSVRSLLKGALIQSGNDAAEILAVNHPQGQAMFIQSMNDKANQLGLNHTYFENASGLDSPNQKISPRDLSRLLWVALEDDFIKETLSEPSAQIFDLSGTVSRTLHNTNQLLWTDFVIAGKTGTTELAGQVLSSLVAVDGHEVIISVMTSQDRYADTLLIYNWLVNSFEFVDLK
jgi:serine-type D-Ala-D-Ala carboxypeptidase (penicillin-binding protein 5/6)